MATLEKAIQDSGLKKSAISRKLGVTTSTLKNWSSKRTLPNVAQAKQLADILNITMSDVLYFFTHDVDLSETEKEVNKNE